VKALQFSVSIPKFIALKTLGLLNKRFYYDSPIATIKLKEIPEPGLPADDWVKIKTYMCGLCGSDVNLVFLKDSPSASPFTSFPCVLGHELCGEVVETGKEVDGIGVGDFVTVAPHLNCPTRGISPECKACQAGRPANCENFAKGSLAPGMFTGICKDINGGFAPYLVAHKTQVFKLPEGVSPSSGAMIEPLSVAVQAVLDNMPNDNDNVLVIGGGVIGNLVVQTIRALGIGSGITVVEPSRFHAEFAKDKGADDIVVGGDIYAETARIAGAIPYTPMMGEKILIGGFTKIFDTVGSSHTVNKALRVLGFQGVLSIVGISDMLKFDPTPLWLKLQTVKGVYGAGYNNFRGSREHAFDTAISLVEHGKIRLDEMATHKFRLEEYKEMIEVNMDKPGNRAIKTMASFLEG